MFKDKNLGDLKLSFVEEDNYLEMIWSGRFLDPQLLHQLKIYLTYLGEISTEFKTRNFIINFKPLEYMNSHTLPPIVEFLKILNERKVKTKIRYEKGSRWQFLTFSALNVVIDMLGYISMDDC